MKALFELRFVIIFMASILFSCGNKEELRLDLKSSNKKESLNSLLSIDYYVDGVSGNNSNSGTSLSTPYKTIQKALDVAIAGSTIYVRGGTYNERLLWKTSGASGAHITLRNYSSEVVILDGSSTSTQDAMIRVNSKSHLTIKNLSIRNNYRAGAKGIHISGSGTDIAIGSCKIYNIGYNASPTGLPVPGNNANPLIIVGDSGTSYNNIYIGNNEIYNCINGYSECLTLNGNIDNFTIEGNDIHDNTNIGIDVAGHYSWTGAPTSVNQTRNGTIRNNIVRNCVSPIATSAGIYSDGATNVIIERNISTGNGCGISLGCENGGKESANLTVRNNIIYNNQKAGIVIGANAGTVTNSKILNNTFYKNRTESPTNAEVHFQNVDNIDFRNNIVYSATNNILTVSSGYIATNLNLNYNMYYGFSGLSSNAVFRNFSSTTYTSLFAYKTGTGLDANSNYYDPLFVSTTLSSPNFSLTISSPAINSGDPAFVAASGELDFIGNARVQNGRVGKGAYEVSSTQSPTP